MNEFFFLNVAYVNLSVLTPPDEPFRFDRIIKVEPNVEFTLDSIFSKVDFLQDELPIVLSLSYNKNGDSMRLESWNQKFVLNKGAVLYIKLTVAGLFGGKLMAGKYFTLTSPFQCFPYYYISSSISSHALSFHFDYFEYSKLLMYQGRLSEYGSYYPMREEHKGSYYAIITTACGVRYTLFEIKEGAVRRKFEKLKSLASKSQWENFHSNFVEVITLE